MRKFVALWIACVLMSGIWIQGVEAHESHQHTDEYGRDNPGAFKVRILHFSHPIVGESPTPDNKHRLNGIFQDEPDADVQTYSYVGEYRFHRGMSVELDVPYTFLDPRQGSDRENLDSLSVELKIANPLFSGSRLLLVHGLGVGLPTGDDSEGIGSNNILELEGVTGFGYKPLPGWELTGFAELGIPTNQDAGQAVETELGWNLSLLRHLNSHWQGLLELDGETVLSAEEEEEDGRDVIHLNPGVKYVLNPRPSHRGKHILGLSWGFPVSGAEEFDSRIYLSYFYHF